MTAGRAAAGGICGILLLAACSSSPPRQPDPPDVPVKASDTACTVGSTKLVSGPVTFSVSNSGSHVTGLAVYGAGERVVGEVDGIGPSASKRLTIALKAGAYDVVCGPDAANGGLRTPITVTAPSGTSPSTSPAQNTAVATYRRYVQAQAQLLATNLKPFADAVRAGDIPRARALYVSARAPYQRIEPIVQAMGDLAARMDARINQVEAGQVWTGFHRLEHDLFATSDITYDGAVADQLEADAAKVVEQVPRLDLSADQVAAAARTLMQDAYSVQAAGQEELYSHVDLADIAAATDGALAAYQALRPLVQSTAPSLVAELDEAYAELRDALSGYGSGGQFIGWETLTETEVRALRGRLAEVLTPLAQLARLVGRS